MKMKRALDLVLTIGGAIVWVPVVTVASLCVLVFSGRPLYYRSLRRVSDGRLIEVVKFRTMVRNAAEIANRSTVPVTGVRFLNIPPDSPLYTRVGRILERFGITELPQFVHVLRGQMSLVGNRPLPENVMACLREEYTDVDDRFLTKAGLTGPTQLVGREELTDEQRLTLEGAYCRAALNSYSLWLDVSILIYTVLIVLGLKKGLDCDGVLDLIERNSNGPKIRAARATRETAPARIAQVTMLPAPESSSQLVPESARLVNSDMRP
jgi:lipopolysaccharide/colanic/teichoic acid biosynthesis glycosyltransferase